MVPGRVLHGYPYPTIPVPVPVTAGMSADWVREFQTTAMGTNPTRPAGIPVEKIVVHIIHTRNAGGIFLSFLVLKCSKFLHSSAQRVPVDYPIRTRNRQVRVRVIRQVIKIVRIGSGTYPTTRCRTLLCMLYLVLK